MVSQPKPTPAALFEAITGQPPGRFLAALKQYRYVVLDRDNIPQPKKATPTAKALATDVLARYALKALWAHHEVPGDALDPCPICKLPMDFGRNA